MKEQPPMVKRLLCDFDNTLCDTAWNPTTEKWVMGLPIEPVVEAVQRASKTHEIVIFTARPVSEWDEMRRWLGAAQVPYSGIFLKPLGIIVDDRSMKPEEFIAEKVIYKEREHEDALSDAEYFSNGDKI